MFSFPGEPVPTARCLGFSGAVQSCDDRLKGRRHEEARLGHIPYLVSLYEATDERVSETDLICLPRPRS